MSKAVPDMTVTNFNPEEEYRNMESYLIKIVERRCSQWTGKADVMAM